MNFFIFHVPKNSSHSMGDSGSAGATKEIPNGIKNTRLNIVTTPPFTHGSGSGAVLDPLQSPCDLIQPLHGVVFLYVADETKK